MANAQKITEIIDEKALRQWLDFVDSLSRGQAQMAKVASEAVDLNKQLGSASTVSQFSKDAEKAALSMEKLAQARAKTTLMEERARQAELRTIEMSERRAKQIERTAMKEEEAARRKAQSAAQIELVNRKIIESEQSVRESVQLTGDVIVQNEKNIENGRKAAAATAISGQKTYRDELEKTNISTADATIENNEYESSLNSLVAIAVRYKGELAEINSRLKTIDSSDTKGIERLTARQFELQTAIQQTNLEIRRVTREQLAVESSSDQLAARLDRLRASWRALSDEERENSEVGKQLEAEIKSLDEQLKALDARVGVNNRNVGDYKIATDGLADSLSKKIPILGTLRQEFEDYTNIVTASGNVLRTFVTGTNSATGATSKLTTSTKLFRLALVSTGIGAIVVILGSLVAYLTSTAEGMDRITSVTRPLQAVLRGLMGILQTIGKVFFDAFTNPRKAIDDIYNFVKNEVIPLFRNFSDVLMGIATLDFSRAKNGVNGITDAVKSATQSVGDFFVETWNTGKEIDRVMKDIRDSELDMIKTQGQLNRTIREQGEIARDSAKSEAERRRAAESALSAINTLTEKQIAIQQKRIDLIKLENKGTLDSYQSQKDLAEAQAELDNIQANAAQQRISITSALNRAQRQGETAAQRAQREAERQAQIQKSLTERQYELTQQLFQAEENRANRAAEAHKRIVDDERAAISDRMDNLMLFLDEREKAITYAYEREAADITSRLAEATRLEIIGRQEEAEVIREIVASQMAALGEQEKEQREQIIRDRNEATLKLIREGLNQETQERIIQINQSAQEEQEALNSQYANREINEAEFDRRRVILSQETSRKLLQIEIEQVEAIIEAQKAKGFGVADEERKLAELKMRLSKQAADAQIDDIERLFEREKELNEAKKDLAMELANLATGLFNNAMERENQRLSKEQENLRIRQEDEKKAVEESTLSEQQKRANLIALEAKHQQQSEEIEQRKVEIKRRQARLDKATAALNIGLNTAQGITSALAMFPPNIPLSVIIGAIGATQLAAVLSAPLPQYYKGTKSSKGGLAHVGERGTELMITPSGEVKLTPPKDTIMNLEKGTRIFTHAETKKILQGKSDLREAIPSLVNLENSQKQGAKMIVKAINSNKKSPSTYITKEGWFNTQSQNSKFTGYLKRNGLK